MGERGLSKTTFKKGKKEGSQKGKERERGSEEEEEGGERKKSMREGQNISLLEGKHF